MNTSDYSYHLFLSYARSDNQPQAPDSGPGWVSAIAKELKRRHQDYSHRDLRIFFDEQSIDAGRDWRRELGAGIRESRLFLAFLSPNYITSENCLWEWDEYLRRELSAARGDDGLTPIFFVTPDDLHLRDDQAIADWLAAMATKYPWLKLREAPLTEETERLARPFARDLSRRNRSNFMVLHPWVGAGPQILRELDAATRLLDLTNTPRDPIADPRDLAERLTGLDRFIARRLDRLALADLAPGNLPRSHEHFVGRHRELSELRNIMLIGGPQSGGSGMGGRGRIAVTFSPGGLGKTALALQYAHAYAEFYAAGGRWVVRCEGVGDLGLALLGLANISQFKDLALRDRIHAASTKHGYLTTPLELSDEENAQPALALKGILAYLRRATLARHDILLEEFGLQVASGRADRHTRADNPPELQRPRALLILDNVDLPGLLLATQVAQLPAEEWLDIIVTTRLNPDRFGGGPLTFTQLEIGVLPEADALCLLAEFQPACRFASAAEENAARRISKALDYWTIALEITAAFIGDRAKKGSPTAAANFLAELETNGLSWVDDLAGKEAFDLQQRHTEAREQRERERQNRVGTLIAWSVARLSPPARTALEFASLLMPDQIPLDWLRKLTAVRHPWVNDTTMSNDHDWPTVWAELRGLRLLHPAQEMEADDRGVEQLPRVVRIHRLVAEHVAKKGLPRHFAEIDLLLFSLATLFRKRKGLGDDADLRAQHVWLFDQLTFIIGKGAANIGSHPLTRTLLLSAQIAAAFESQHGSPAKAHSSFASIRHAQKQFPLSSTGEESTTAPFSRKTERLYQEKPPMNDTLRDTPPGFVLESADSVRFGPEYTPVEQERNRQILFGEMLCGLLMGEQLWTNAVFAFDSRGTVEVLGAVARAFLREPGKDQFLPFLLSVYDLDLDTWTGERRPWQNPGELFLRAYAHRLNNIHLPGKPGFQLSATPVLDQDGDRRKSLALEINRLAGTGGEAADIRTVCSPEEQLHLQNLLHIDRYFRSWLGTAATSGFADYAGRAERLGSPLRLNRGDWTDAYLDGGTVRGLRYFLGKAAGLPKNTPEFADLPPEPFGVLGDVIRNLSADDTAFKNRSNFRAWLREHGHADQSLVYRVLTELTDGHYVRTQQSVLTSANREVTSPASQSASSQAGEKWASATMRACLKPGQSGQSWQFINEIKAASAKHGLRIDLDAIAKHFADYMKHPDRRQALLTYHRMLHEARRQQLDTGNLRGSAGLASLLDLSDFAHNCCNNINQHMARACGVRFRFNTNVDDTGAGSLTLVYLGNKATFQATGNPLPVGKQQSEGASHSLPEPASS